MSSNARRRIVSRIFEVLCAAAVLVALVPLALILFYVIKEGAGALNLSFFTQMPKPVGEPGGGMANAIVGTLVIIATASAIGLPIGIGAGLYLAEKRSTPLAYSVRFLSDVLNGLPSIVIGIFAWEFLVRPIGHFSALAGGVALGSMMIPLVTRTTEEMLHVVPTSLREAALALGYPRWRTSISVVLRTALAGIATGALVAVARIAGETAPLLFTAFGNQFWSFSANQPIAALPLQIFTYAISPFDEWHRQAWAGALLLVIMIVGTTTVVRLVFQRRMLGEAR